MSVKAAERGFTLVEVLISVLIMSVGLLGVAAMQARSLGGTSLASKRSQAILLAGDIADRIRANRTAGDPTAGSNYATILPADNGCRVAHYNHVHATPNNCTTDQLAADDLADWNARISGILPAGAGTVCLDSTPNDGALGAPACDGAGNSYAIKIFWTEKSDNNSAAPNVQRFVTEIRP